MITEEVCDTKTSLAELAEPIKLYPQFTKNVRVTDKAAVLSDKCVLDALKEVEKSIDGNGRALLRQSGTEPVIRIMIECEDEESCKKYADQIADKVKERGYEVE